MKQRKSLFFTLEEPTEKQLLAEIDEFFCSLERTLINPTAEDFAAAAKIFFVPIIRKALKRAEASRREAKKVNENHRETTNRRKRTARTIIEGAIKKDPSLRLRGKQTKLAKRVQAGWPKHDKLPAIRPLRHWLAEMRLEKK
jgi:hypothetical protein